LGAYVEEVYGRCYAQKRPAIKARVQAREPSLPIWNPGTQAELSPEPEIQNGPSDDSCVWNSFPSTAVGEPLKPFPHVSVPMGPNPLPAPIWHALERKPAVRAVPQPLLEITLRNAELRRTLQPVGDLNPHPE
jgi:hypothetical protein